LAKLAVVASMDLSVTFSDAISPSKTSTEEFGRSGNCGEPSNISASTSLSQTTKTPSPLIELALREAANPVFDDADVH